jgi:hypothetical protein
MMTECIVCGPKLILTCLAGFMLTGCIIPPPLAWPESPLYELPVNDPNWVPPADQAEAMQAMAGRYAHFDVVAYEADTPTGPLSTFIISYGFTELVIEAGQLVEHDSFCTAVQKANQPFVTSFPDAATQAIEPRSAVVQVYQDGGDWKLYRPVTPTLIGIEGDPNQPLSRDRNDPLINDPDQDGRPGVTAFLTLYGFIEGEIYLARREIFQNELTLYSDGSLRGRVIDNSEQLVIGASLAILDAPNEPTQRPDPGLNPLILIPIGDDVDTCAELIAMRDALFPPEPEF